MNNPDHKDTIDLIRQLRHLVSLDDPLKGGPYEGFAAREIVEAMTKAADMLEQSLRKP